MRKVRATTPFTLGSVRALVVAALSGILASALLACSSSAPEPTVEAAPPSSDTGDEVAPADQSALLNDPGIWDRMFAPPPETPEVGVVDERTRTALKERGAYLVRGPAACGSCHGARVGDPGAPLSGGQQFKDRFGSVYAANITPDSETGIGGWSINDVARALRASLDRNGRPLSIDLHSQYRWLSDADAKAIALHVLSLPPVLSGIERRELGDFERKRWGIFSQHRQVEGYIPSPPKSKSGAYGRYLAYHVTGCYGCHTPEGGVVTSATPFSGSQGESRGIVSSFKALFDLVKPKSEEVKTEEEASTLRSLLSAEGQEEYLGTKEAVNTSTAAVPAEPARPELKAEYDEAVTTGQRPLTGPDIRSSADSGIVSWSKEDLVRYLATGSGPDGRPRDPRVCPWPWFQRMSDSDREALAGFLKQQ